MFSNIFNFCICDENCYAPNYFVLCVKRLSQASFPRTFKPTQHLTHLRKCSPLEIVLRAIAKHSFQVLIKCLVQKSCTQYRISLPAGPVSNMEHQVMLGCKNVPAFHKSHMAHPQIHNFLGSMACAITYLNLSEKLKETLTAQNTWNLRISDQCIHKRTRISNLLNPFVWAVGLWSCGVHGRNT